MSNSIVFDLFRYQIIPIAQAFQLSLLETPEDILRKKNEYFFTAFSNAEFQSAGKILNKKLAHSLDNFYVFQIGRPRNIKIYKPNFSPEHTPSYPPTFILIDNNPLKQIIAVEQNNLFSSTATVINLIIKHINVFLKDKNLVTKTLPIFEEKSFWQFVREHKSGIKQVEFTLITPNMSNISKTLSEDLKRTAQLSKTAETRLKFQSDKDNVLEIDENNQGITSLVEYASEGGGRVLIRGVTAKYDSKKNQKTVTIESIYSDSEESIRIIREIINGKID